ncbi:MAG: FMN-binding protein [Bacillota bacterium]
MRVRPLFIVLGLVVLAVAVFMVPILAKLKRYQADAMNRIGKVDVDLGRVEDGTYSGHYDTGPVIVDVDVTVKNHVITSVNLVRHRNGQGAAGEGVIGKVLAAQSIKVDAVSGATMSSYAILLAIEDALK